MELRLVSKFCDIKVFLVQVEDFGCKHPVSDEFADPLLQQITLSRPALTHEDFRKTVA